MRLFEPKTPGTTQPRPSVPARLLRRAVIGGAMLFALMAMMLFAGAGTFAWPQGWVFLLVFFAWTIGMSVWLYHYDPALFMRRARGGPTSEKEVPQKIIMSIMSLAFIALLIVPALDRRFGWSHAPLWLRPVGNVLLSLGWLIVVRVFKENSYTASTVEVMPGQAVVSTGPYAIVRHPMYAGGMLLLLGMPLALGSWWGLSPIAIILPTLIWRLMHEERLLTRDLPGYAEYTAKVPYRLIPGGW